MIIVPPDINHITIFGLNIHYYSICMFLAVFLSWAFIKFFIDKLNLDLNKEIIDSFCPALIFFSIIGARLYYVILAFDYYFSNPSLIFMVWHGGISIHGAILAGILYGIYFFKKNKLNFFKYADVFALVLPLGQAIGRWGNFFNSEAFGVPVSENALFALYVAEKYRPGRFFNFEYFHPVFLYESILDFIIFLVLIFVMKKTAKKIDGFVFFLYMILYSFVRLILEFYRVDTIFYVKNFPFPSIVSIIGIFAGIIGLFARIKHKHII